MDDECPFCRIAERGELDDGSPIFMDLGYVVAFRPLRPVTDGHLLVIPRDHIPHALWLPHVTVEVFRRAAEIAPHPCNLITSVGSDATQTVEHFHVHIVPRRPGDGLKLPWTPDSPQSSPLAAGDQFVPLSQREGINTANMLYRRASAAAEGPSMVDKLWRRIESLEDQVGRLTGATERRSALGFTLDEIRRAWWRWMDSPAPDTEEESFDAFIEELTHGT